MYFDRVSSSLRRTKKTGGSSHRFVVRPGGLHDGRRAEESTQIGDSRRNRFIVSSLRE